MRREIRILLDKKKREINLRRENRHYRRKFQELKVDFNKDYLQRELKKKARPSHAEKKRKGESLRIFAAFHHYTWEDYNLQPALEKFGEAVRYNWYPKFDHESSKWTKSIKKEMNRDLLQSIRDAHKTEKIDVFFAYLSGYIIYPSTIEEIGRLGIPSVNFSLNDKEHFCGKRGKDGCFTGVRDIARYFDLAWTSTEDAVPKYLVEGALPIYLPEGANPEVYRSYPELEKDIDVSFVGQKYGDRPKTIDFLKRNGIKVEVYGYGWESGSLILEEMVKLYSRSKINLGFSGVWDYGNTFCLKARDFEIPMSRGLYLTQYHPELANAYKIGEEIICYRSKEELLEKVRYLLSHPKEAETIREAGYRRAQREHTWERRFKEIFQTLGVLKG